MTKKHVAASLLSVISIAGMLGLAIAAQNAAPAQADTYARPAALASKSLVLQDRKSTRLNSSHIQKSRMPSSA